MRSNLLKILESMLRSYSSFRELFSLTLAKCKPFFITIARLHICIFFGRSIIRKIDSLLHLFYYFIKCWLYFLEWGVAQKSRYMVNIQSIYGALSAFKSWKTINNFSEMLDPNIPIFQNYINLHKLQQDCL